MTSVGISQEDCLSTVLLTLYPAIRIEEETGQEIMTNVGVPQEDCFSTILLTLYPAKAMKETRMQLEEEHNYSKPILKTEPKLPQHLKDHSYYTQKEGGPMLDQYFVDNLGWIAVNNNEKLQVTKKEMPKQLKKQNLLINEGKNRTVQNQTRRTRILKIMQIPGQQTWFKRRHQKMKGLAINTATKLKNILQSKTTSNVTKQSLSGIH